MKSQYFMSFFLFFHSFFWPFCQRFQNRLTLSPAPHHPHRVKGSQEASGAACTHRPEGLHRTQAGGDKTQSSGSVMKILRLDGWGEGSGGRLFPVWHVIGCMPSRFRKREMISRRQNLDRGHLYGETCVLSKEMQRAWPCWRHRGEGAGMFCRRIQNW